VTAHWGVDDPAAVEGEGQRAAFTKAFHELKRRIDLFLALPLDSIDEMTLANRLREIGSREPAVG
jgi:arsenate reductase